MHAGRDGAAQIFIAVIDEIGDEAGAGLECQYILVRVLGVRSNGAGNSIGSQSVDTAVSQRDGQFQLVGEGKSGK